MKRARQLQKTRSVGREGIESRVPRRLTTSNPTDGKAALPLPGLRPGVVMLGEGEDAELRDVQLGQVVKLGEVASVIVGLLDGTRDAEGLLADAARVLGEELNPLGLVELLQALDRRALLDTPRARMVVAQGLVRADIAALQRLANRRKLILDYEPDGAEVPLPQMAPGSAFACKSCNRCCSEDHLLGPVTRAERDAILLGFAEKGDDRGADPSNFLPLPTAGSAPVYLLRPREGHCSYLGRDGLCRVHSVLGEEVKPSVCRLFPFRAVATPDGWHVGMSLLCPTVAAGEGPDPRPEARRTVRALQVLTPHLRKVPDTVLLTDGLPVPWATFAEWEQDAQRALADEGTPVAEAWLAAIDAFEEMVETARAEMDDDLSLGPDLQQTTAESPPLTDEIEATVELNDPGAAADLLLKDLALWSELLVGLEAADPMALRRFRSGVLRVRGRVGVRANAAPVLAELARLDARRAAPPAGVSAPGAVTSDDFAVPTDLLPDQLAQQQGEAVQRRFLSQALAEKRAFEYGTIARGLLALTVLVSTLRLDRIEGDERHPRVSDVAYLVNHPQLTDIIDTRSVVRSRAAEAGVHAVLLRS
jgi:Fe-S-cluster containining protein